MMRFSCCHPAVSAVYFLSVLLITMFTANPILLFSSLMGGLILFFKAQNHNGIFKEFGFYLLLFTLVAITNPLFSHNGITTLFFLNGNPVTLEAVLYGVDMGIMLIAVVYWFKCFNLIMTEDKLLYLFGSASPKISLLISSALRFIPRLKNQSAKIRQSQKVMGLYASDTWTDKLKGTLRVYSALITWALENAIDMGSSMKARGYGLKGRSRYSLYKFKTGDAFLIAFIAISDTVVVSAMLFDRLDFTFYPAVSYTNFNFYTLLAIADFVLLCLLPFMLEVKEDIVWKYYKSRI